MPPTLQQFGIDRLNADDRLSLAEAIWASVADELERAPISAAQRTELERRWADSVARPDAITSWDEVKAQALARVKP